MEHYFRDDVRDFVLSEYMSGNHDLIETYLADRSEQEKAYWLRGAPAGRGVELDANQMAACLALLQKAYTQQVPGYSETEDSCVRFW